MYLQIKKIETVADKFGSHLVIKMIGLYDETGKWIKWVKLAEVAKFLNEAKIPIKH